MYYKNSNESCTFALVAGADWSVRGLLKISAVLLKYPTFEFCFFTFFYTKLEFLYTPKMLSNTYKITKTVNFGFKVFGPK